MAIKIEFTTLINLILPGRLTTKHQFEYFQIDDAIEIGNNN